MDNLSKKQDLTADQIKQIQYILAEKSNIWMLSGGRVRDGVEIFRTQDDEIFVIKDVETGVELGMRKQVKHDGVMTHLSFFDVEKD